MSADVQPVFLIVGTDFRLTLRKGGVKTRVAMCNAYARQNALKTGAFRISEPSAKEYKADLASYAAKNKMPEPPVAPAKPFLGRTGYCSIRAETWT